jgi:hypothetical protein
MLACMQTLKKVFKPIIANKLLNTDIKKKEDFFQITEATCILEFLMMIIGLSDIQHT